MILDFNINLWAVLFAAITSIVLGALWYGPLFGKKWMKLAGFSKSDADKAKKKGMGKFYFIGFVASFITAYVLGLFVMGDSISTALNTVFFIWIGFFGAVMLGSVIWEMKPFNLYLLNVTYWLINLEIMAIILAIWA